jgi:hypothetical protein
MVLRYMFTGQKKTLAKSGVCVRSVYVEDRHLLTVPATALMYGKDEVPMVTVV